MPGRAPEPVVNDARCSAEVPGAPELAYALWTDPELLAAWMGYRESGGGDKPRLIAVRDVHIAPREGADFGLVMVTRETEGTEKAWPHHGRVLGADPPSSIRFTWISEGTEHRETVLRLGFEETSDGTRIALTHEGFATEEMARQHADGWELLLELFNETMISAASAGVKIAAGELRRRLAARRVGEGGAASDLVGSGEPAHGEAGAAESDRPSGAELSRPSPAEPSLESSDGD